jgi:hypothetical protein
VMNVLGTLAALLLVVAQPATRPSFSGEWKMNAAKSDFGVLPPPASIRRTITHAEPALMIIEEQKSDQGDQNTTRKYVTDGSAMTFTSNGADVKSSARWEDAKTLLVVSDVEIVGLTFRDKMSLSPDGKMLTSQIHISSPQGDVDITVAFDKQ